MVVKVVLLFLLAGLMQTDGSLGGRVNTLIASVNDGTSDDGIATFVNWWYDLPIDSRRHLSIGDMRLISELMRYDQTRFLSAAILLQSSSDLSPVREDIAGGLSREIYLQKKIRSGSRYVRPSTGEETLKALNCLRRRLIGIKPSKSRCIVALSYGSDLGSLR